MSTTSSRNFTTLYSGSGSVVPQGAYGNANVVSLLAAGTDGANTVTTISATGNIVTDAYFVGNFAGNITGNIAVTGSNTQVLFNNAGNVGAAAGLTFNSASNVLATTGSVTATGNVQGNYFIGNGSQLTGLPATYGNANVAANLAAFGSNPISTTGNVTAGYFVGDGSQLTNLPIGGYSNANVASFMAVFGSNVISSTGNITTTANVAGNYILGNGSQLTGLPATYGNANVVSLLAAFGSNTISTTGNITGGNLITTGVVYTPQVEAAVDLDLNATGKVNVNSNVRVGDNNTNTQIATHGTGDLILRTHEGDANQGSITIFDGANGNIALAPNGTGQVTAGIISTTGNITSAGNVTAGNISVSGNVNLAVGTDINFAGAGLVNENNHLAYSGAALGLGSYNTGNTTGNATVVFDGAAGNIDITAGSTQNWNFAGATGNLTLPSNTAAINYANGVSILSGLPSTYGNSNVVTLLAAFGSNTIVTTGNITGGNVVAAANLTSTQQTVIGTANVGTTGNIVISGKNIATDMAFVPDGGNTVNAALSRIVAGTGWVGNITHSAVQNRALVQDTFARGNTGTSVQLFATDPIVSLTGNVTNGSFRTQALGARVRIGGGSAANTISPTFATGTVGVVAALQPNIDVGNASPYFLGNTSISQALLNGGFITVSPGSTVTVGYGMVPGVSGSGVATYIGSASNLNAATITGNVYAFYHGSNTTLSTTGIATNNNARSAANYYAFYNADSVAQVQLGSLRSYNEFQYATATSGTVNIDKTNAQVQFIAPTANVTIGSYLNFVTTANDGTNNDTQADTVTLIIQQGATPYTVTMPTGNASIKYSGNVTTVGSTANSVTMVSITAFRSSANAAIYLTTISPEFV